MMAFLEAINEKAVKISITDADRHTTEKRKRTGFRIREITLYFTMGEAPRTAHWAARGIFTLAEVWRDMASVGCTPLARTVLISVAAWPTAMVTRPATPAIFQSKT